MRNVVRSRIPDSVVGVFLRRQMPVAYRCPRTDMLMEGSSEARAAYSTVGIEWEEPDHSFRGGGEYIPFWTGGVTAIL